MSRSFDVCFVCAALFLLLFDQTCQATPYLLVNGQSSQDVVRFDLDTGAASLYATYKPNADPRNLAMDADGNIYSSLLGGNLNVVKLVPQTGTHLLTTVDFTASIGGDGPGQIQFYNGELYVAGDESRVIHVYNGSTGQQIGTLGAAQSGNIRAMAITGNTMYYEEAFQNRVHETDLTQLPTTWTTLLDDPTNLQKAINMTIGPQGDLVFANNNNTLIPMYNSAGTFLGNLADVKTFDSTLTNAWDVTYYAPLNEYFVSGGNEVFELSATGALLHTFSSPFLQGATGLLVVPEPSSIALLAIGALGLVAIVRRRWNASIADRR
ncbi:MAG TPA: PEP-CTERM sorting domain-containing protein [Pirellulales bacterium]|jgi:hypothetical protein